MAACFVAGLQKVICKLWHHLWLSLESERPFQKVSRQPADISGDKSITVMDILC